MVWVFRQRELDKNLRPKMASPQGLKIFSGKKISKKKHHSLTLLGTKISLAASPAETRFVFLICDHSPGGVDHHPQLPFGSCRKKSRFQVPSSEGFTGLAATLIKTCPGCFCNSFINFAAGGAGKSIIPAYHEFQENSHTLRNHEQLWLATPTHQLGRRVHETELEHIDILEPIKWPLASCHCVPITLSQKNRTQESRNGWLDKHG